MAIFCPMYNGGSDSMQLYYTSVSGILVTFGLIVEKIGHRLVPCTVCCLRAMGSHRVTP